MRKIKMTKEGKVKVFKTVVIMVYIAFLSLSVGVLQLNNVVNQNKIESRSELCNSRLNNINSLYKLGVIEQELNNKIDSLIKLVNVKDSLLNAPNVNIVYKVPVLYKSVKAVTNNNNIVVKALEVNVLTRYLDNYIHKNNIYIQDVTGELIPSTNLRINKVIINIEKTY